MRSLKDEPMILLSLSFQLITLVLLWNGLLDDLVLFFSLILPDHRNNQAHPGK